MISGRSDRSLGFAIFVMSILALSPDAFGDLTHRYSFNDGSANDSVGNINGQLMNGATVTGGSLVFSPVTNDGVNTNPATGQYVSFPSELVGTTNFTIEAWVTWGGGNPWQRFFDEGTPSGGTSSTFLILTLGSQLDVLGQLTLANRQTTAAGSLTALATGSHMIAFTHLYQGVDSISDWNSVFIDGTFYDVGNVPATDGALTNFTNFYIGRSQFAADPFLDGSMNELRIYNNALTHSQLLADYSAGPDVVASPEPLSALTLIFGILPLFRRRR